LTSQDSATGSEHSLRWSFYRVTNITTISFLTTTNSYWFGDSVPNVFISLVVSFSFQLAAAICSLLLMALTVICLLLEHTEEKEWVQENQHTVGLTTLVLCVLIVVFSFTAIFQFIFSLPHSFRQDVTRVETNCFLKVSVCNSFMNSFTQSTQSWTWGPNIGWILALATLLFALGSVFSTFLIFNITNSESNQRRQTTSVSHFVPSQRQSYISLGEATSQSKKDHPVLPWYTDCRLKVTAIRRIINLQRFTH